MGADAGIEPGWLWGETGCLNRIAGEAAGWKRGGFREKPGGGADSGVGLGGESEEVLALGAFASDGL